METRDLADTVVAITGATSGVGRATAFALVGAGAKVALTGRRADRLAQLEEQLGTENVVCVVGDTQDPATSVKLIESAVDRFGRLDSLVASAGIGAYGGVLDGTDAELMTTLRTNIVGTVWAVRAAVPHFRAAHGGDIVIIASVAGLRGGRNEVVYAARKFAQVGFAGAIDRELRPDCIRVTALCPAAIATEFAIGAGRIEDDPWLDDVLTADDVASSVLKVLRQPRPMCTTQWSMWSMVEAS